MSTSFSEGELEAFFVGVPESVGHVRERFRPFEYFRPGEVALSRIIADLLNPEGSHGYADRFLVSFLGCISETRFGDTAKTATVTPNYPTEDGRLIDITVSSDQFILGIENKPWAREGHEQVTDYLRELQRKRTANGYRLLYLSGDGSSPSSLQPQEIKTLTRENRFQVFRYWKVVSSWLDCCQRERLDDDKGGIRAFLGFFHRYASAQEEAQMLTEHILGDRTWKRLRIALAVANSADEVRDRIIRAFAADIKQALSTALAEKVEIENPGYERYTGIYLGRPEWSYKVGIQSQGRGCEFVFGLCNNRAKHSAAPMFPNLVAKLIEKLGPGKSSNDWEWYRHLGTPFGRGHTADEVVLEICSNRAAATQVFADRMKEIFALVKSLPAD